MYYAYITYRNDAWQRFTTHRSDQCATSDRHRAGGDTLLPATGRTPSPTRLPG